MAFKFEPPEGYVEIKLPNDNYTISESDYIFSGCCGVKGGLKDFIGDTYEEYETESGCKCIRIAISPDRLFNNEVKPQKPKVKQIKVPGGRSLIEFDGDYVLQEGDYVYTDYWFVITSWAGITVDKASQRGEKFIKYIARSAPIKPRFENTKPFPHGY